MAYSLKKSKKKKVRCLLYNSAS